METGNVSECEMLAASLPIGEGTVDGGGTSSATRMPMQNDENVW